MLKNERAVNNIPVIFDGKDTNNRCLIKIQIVSLELVSNGVETNIVCQTLSDNEWINDNQDYINEEKQLTLAILTEANKYKIQGFPTIKIFAGSNKRKGEDYEGGRSAQAIVDAGTKAIKKVLKERQSDSGGSRGSKSKSKGSGNSDGGGGNEKKGKGGKGKGKGKGNGVVTLNAFDFGDMLAIRGQNDGSTSDCHGGLSE